MIIINNEKRKMNEMPGGFIFILDIKECGDGLAWKQSRKQTSCIISTMFIANSIMDISSFHFNFISVSSRALLIGII